MGLSKKVEPISLSNTLDKKENILITSGVLNLGLSYIDNFKESYDILLCAKKQADTTVSLGGVYEHTNIKKVLRVS